MIINANKGLNIVEYAKKLPEDHKARQQLNKMFELLDVIANPITCAVSFDVYEKQVQEFLDQFNTKSAIIMDIKKVN